jgi:hypothetical protein
VGGPNHAKSRKNPSTHKLLYTLPSTHKLLSTLTEFLHDFRDFARSKKSQITHRKCLWHRGLRYLRDYLYIYIY